MPNKNTRALSYRKELDTNLFEEISQLARGDASDQSFKELAAAFLLDDAVVYGTASFYDFTRIENRKQIIHVCNGTSCLTAGTQDKLTAEIHKHFDKDEVGHASCLGHCHSNSAFLYDDKTYSVADFGQLESIIKAPKTIPNTYHIGCSTTPILTGNITNLSQFYALANQFSNNQEGVTQELKDAKLRGRGGAGFPFWFKLDAVAQETNTQKYIVCNADEGDPGAYSDMYLLEKQPHKVLFGMYISGLTVGADTGVLYIRGEYPNAIKIVEKAILELKEKGLAPDFRFKIIKGQGSYVCGEETALLSSIEGLRPEVRVRPPYPAQEGLFGKPTLLSNVETFANIHWILDNTGKAYAKLGTAQSTGTKLVSLDSFFNQPGIYEVEMGMPLEKMITDLGKGYKEPIKAIQIGGPLGGIVPINKIADLSLDFESLNDNGFLLGHASFVCIPTDFPMIKFIEHLLKFTADESCGKCYPCRIGAHRGFEMIEKAQHDNYKIDRELFDDLLETLEIGSLCALGGGVPLPVKNALTYFKEELQVYFE